MASEIKNKHATIKIPISKFSQNNAEISFLLMDLLCIVAVDNPMSENKPAKFVKAVTIATIPNASGVRNLAKIAKLTKLSTSRTACVTMVNTPPCIVFSARLVSIPRLEK